MAQTGKTSSKASGGKKKNAGSGRPDSQSPSFTPKPIRREVGAVICLFLGIFSIIGYFQVEAWFIEIFCGFIKGLIGWGYYIFPPALLLSAAILGVHRGRPIRARVLFSMLLPLMLGSLAHILFCRGNYEFSKGLISELYKNGRQLACGGVVSGTLAMAFNSMFSVYGAIPVFFFAFAFFLMMSLDLNLPGIIDIIKNRPKREYEFIEEPERRQEPERAFTRMQRHAPRRQKAVIDIPIDDNTATGGEETVFPEERIGFFKSRPRVRTPDQVLVEPEQPCEEPESLNVNEEGISGIETQFAQSSMPEVVEPASVQVIHEPPKIEIPAKKLRREDVITETENISKSIESALTDEREEYEFPPVTLLRTGGASTVDGREEVALNRERLEATIRSFGVNAGITNVTRGPTVTRYDLELEAGVKLNKLTNLAGDLALSLGVSGVRIAPIPDKISTVGVEVPNKLVSTVYLRDIIDSNEFKKAPSKLTFAIGKDIGGNSIVGNISKLPHMLIAGTTGSGKSVCMNSLILSILYKATPEEARLIMIDPKMVELGIYNSVPHLFIPVVTDPKKAAGALQWSVVEMLKRYRLFSEVGVRDLSGYNAYQKRSGGQTLPQVVIVIDELADLMLVASKEVEESICRVAQMGRASGMHLIIATQRPSADVITGLMKANIPSRIAFAVSSAMESRIILDAQGAEKLVGSGDMLYSPIGMGKPMRVQGAFVSDEEREQVISFVKEKSEAQYSDEILDQIERSVVEKGGQDRSGKEDEPAQNDYDELLPQAVEVILESNQASVSLLQRRLKLGYARAARIVDQMEESGIVGPFEGSKPRSILLTKAQWQERSSGGTVRQFVREDDFDPESGDETYEEEYGDE